MKDFAKDPRKEGVKDLPKDAIKDNPKDGIKEFADDVPKQLRDPVKELGGEIGPIDPGPLIDPSIGGGGFGGGAFGGGATPFVIGGRDETEYGGSGSVVAGGRRGLAATRRRLGADYCAARLSGPTPCTPREGASALPRRAAPGARSSCGGGRSDPHRQLSRQRPRRAGTRAPRPTGRRKTRQL